MDITLSESEQLVRNSLRELLTREVTTEFVQGVESEGRFPAALWHILAGQGWLGVGAGDVDGGAGGSLVEWALALEELGRVACPLPVVEHLATVVYLAQTGADAQ